MRSLRTVFYLCPFPFQLLNNLYAEQNLLQRCKDCSQWIFLQLCCGATSLSTRVGKRLTRNYQKINKSIAKIARRVWRCLLLPSHITRGIMINTFANKNQQTKQKESYEEAFARLIIFNLLFNTTNLFYQQAKIFF